MKRTLFSLSLLVLLSSCSATFKGPSTFAMVSDLDDLRKNMKVEEKFKSELETTSRASIKLTCTENGSVSAMEGDKAPLLSWFTTQLDEAEKRDCKAYEAVLTY